MGQADLVAELDDRGPRTELCSNRRVLKRVSVLLVVLVVAGCASKEQICERTEAYLLERAATQASESRRERESAAVKAHFRGMCMELNDKELACVGRMEQLAKAAATHLEVTKACMDEHEDWKPCVAKSARKLAATVGGCDKVLDRVQRDVLRKDVPSPAAEPQG